jgi:hypothetical protein
MIKVTITFLTNQQEFWTLNNKEINAKFEVCKKLAKDAVARIDNLIALSKKKQSVLPVFKWGQSKQEIFMEVKLSHRFDAPGCLESIDSKEVDKMIKIENSRFDYIRLTVR